MTIIMRLLVRSSHGCRYRSRMKVVRTMSNVVIFLIGMAFGVWLGMGVLAIMTVSSWEARREEQRKWTREERG